MHQINLLKISIPFFFFFLSSFSLQSRDINMTSPGGKIQATFYINSDGSIGYTVAASSQNFIKESKLGIRIKEDELFDSNFLIKADSSVTDNTWEPVWGEESTIRNHYKEYIFRLCDLKNKDIQYNIIFRLFDDGLGFRYDFPKQPLLNYFTIIDELTEFNLSGDFKAFWIPGDYDTNEFQYSTTKISGVSRAKNPTSTSISGAFEFGDHTTQTPLMLKAPSGLYVNIHEAALINYPAMELDVDVQKYKLKAHLVPDAVGNKAYMQTPCVTPWRTIIASKKATEILASKIILNLNDAAPIADYSWIKPMKYVGIWWEMHVNRSTWNYSDESNTKIGVTDYSTLKPNGKHGANNENVKKYIDFAADNGFGGVLVEGWNVGWEDWFGKWKEDVFDFVTPYPDFDIQMLSDYAKSKNVSLIMHHETSASATNYERHQDAALDLMKKYGYPAAKSGYVGRIIPRGEHHDGQWMVNHYNRTAANFLKNKLMLDAHEPVRPTGLQRTFPNWMASEAGRGMEFNAWSSGNPPDHETILPFTRLMGGPMDYTPGIFQTDLSYYDKNKKETIHTTLAKQLALYITMYSPLQMAADLPENYLRFPDAFQFIKDVAVNWSRSVYLDAEPGDYIYVARKEKSGNNWFVGCITDEVSRKANISLNFLDPGKTYKATIYADTKDADYEKNPMSYKITNVLVNNKSKLPIYLAPGGGSAITIQYASKADIKALKSIDNKSFIEKWEKK